MKYIIDFIQDIVVFVRVDSTVRGFSGFLLNMLTGPLLLTFHKFAIYLYGRYLFPNRKKPENMFVVLS